MHPEKPHFRTALAPARTRVPEFDAVDDSPVTGQIDHPRRAAGRNFVPDRDRLRAAVTEMNDHAVEFYGGSFDAYLYSAIFAACGGNHDVVVINGSIHIGLAQIFP